MSSTITQDDLFRAVLALDVYHRGYNSGLGLSDDPGARVGDAVVDNSSKTQTLIDGIDHQQIGFYALQYTWNGSTVIAYRGH